VKEQVYQPARPNFTAHTANVNETQLQVLSLDVCRDTNSERTEHFKISLALSNLFHVCTLISYQPIYLYVPRVLLTTGVAAAPRGTKYSGITL
jgi:hypothetical protein